MSIKDFFKKHTWIVYVLVFLVVMAIILSVVLTLKTDMFGPNRPAGDLYIATRISDSKLVPIFTTKDSAGAFTNPYTVMYLSGLTSSSAAGYDTADMATRFIKSAFTPAVPNKLYEKKTEAANTVFSTFVPVPL